MTAPRTEQSGEFDLNAYLDAKEGPDDFDPRLSEEPEPHPEPGDMPGDPEGGR
jgi:hypothetical protein